MVTWLDSVVYGEAGLTFMLSGLNSASIAGMAARASSPARRVGASALAFVCAGVAVESLAFLALAAPASEMTPVAAAALLCVRSLLLVSTLAMTLLVLRAVAR
jgi:hypothetical protein